ncbi:MAG: hypothetical protein JXR10_13435, partial [Cyclobacteriaceae bacterium]
ANIIAATSGTNTGDQDISGIATNVSAIDELETEQDTQDAAIALNTAKTGITAGQASAITANTAKVGITTAQAGAITSNTSGVSTNASVISDLETEQDVQDAAIALNTAKTGITTSQANIIAATSGTNTGDQDISGIATNASAIDDLETEQDTQDAAIALNTAKTGITAGQASAITVNTAKVGYTDAAVTSVIAANAIVAANTAKNGITAQQASEINVNTTKVGVTTGLKDSVATNYAKVGITTAQADAITANTAKVGITTSQSDAITANTAKLTNATHTGDVTGTTALTIGNDKILESHLKAVNSPTDEYILTYEATTGDFEWVAPATVASTVTWDDLQVNLNSVKKRVGVDEPQDVIYRGGGLLNFENGKTEGIYFTVQLPHQYKPDSEIRFHVHLIYEGGSGNVEWEFTYTWANVNDAFPTETTVTATTSAGTADVHQAQTIAAIGGIDKRESSVLICSLTRNGSSGADTYSGDVKMVALDFHYQKEKSGTITEF